MQRYLKDRTTLLLIFILFFYTVLQFIRIVQIPAPVIFEKQQTNSNVLFYTYISLFIFVYFLLFVYLPTLIIIHLTISCNYKIIPITLKPLRQLIPPIHSSLLTTGIKVRQLVVMRC